MPKVRRIPAPRPMKTYPDVTEVTKSRSMVSKRAKYPPREDMGPCKPTYGKVTVLVLYNDNIKE